MITPPAARNATATAALLCAAALAAACGSVQQNPARGQPTAPPATPPAASAAASSPGPASASPSAGAGGQAASACASSALRVTVNTSQSGAAAGITYYPIEFRNSSGSACTLFGYPGVSFAAGPSSGSRIGRAAHRNPAASPTTVTLAPGRVAHATLQVADAGNYPPSQCEVVSAHWLKIYPPNQFDPVYAQFTAQACSAMLPGHASQLGVYVVRAGAGKRGQLP